MRLSVGLSARPPPVQKEFEQELPTPLDQFDYSAVANITIPDDAYAEDVEIEEMGMKEVDKVGGGELKQKL